MIIITIPGYPPWNQPIAPLKKWVFGRRSFPYGGKRGFREGIYVLSKGGGYSLLWIEITQLAAAPFLNANSFVPNGGLKLAAAPAPNYFRMSWRHLRHLSHSTRHVFCIRNIMYYICTIGITLLKSLEYNWLVVFHQPNVWVNIKHFLVNHPPKIS